MHLIQYFPTDRIIQNYTVKISDKNLTVAF